MSLHIRGNDWAVDLHVIPCLSLCSEVVAKGKTLALLWKQNAKQHGEEIQALSYRRNDDLAVFSGTDIVVASILGTVQSRIQLLYCPSKHPSW